MTRLLLSALLLFVLSPPARAHDAGMTAATVIVQEAETRIELSIKGSDLERATGVELLSLTTGFVDPARLANSEGAIETHLRATMAIATETDDCPLEFADWVPVEDGILVVVTAPCGTGEAALSYRTSLLHQINPSTIQHVVLLKGDDIIPAALTREHSRLDIQSPRPLIGVAVDYLLSGAEHIFAGYDHLAFLLALLLWARSVWAVVKVVTAFTISHSVTLSLAALDLVNLPSGLIEPLIAASVVAVALENFFHRKIEGRWRVAFFLGFIHGFGFAAVLRDFGLPQDALLVALAFFNIGVEIGQVAIVAIVVPCLFLIDRLMARTASTAERKPALVYAASAPIAALGGYWLIERTLLA